MTKIIYVDHSIGNNFGEHIEINENLKLYPELHDYVLKHELGHTKNPTFTIKDAAHDLGGEFGMGWKLIGFCFKHPKAFWQFSPVLKRDKILYWDINMLILYTLVLFILIGAGALFWYWWNIKTVLV